MKLNDLLIKKKSSILNHWLKILLETYSSDARRFFTKQKDQFANPVGTTLKRELERLYDLYLQEWDTNQISSVLENIIRLRAIQDFIPSQAVSFIFELKTIIRAELKNDIKNHDLQDEVLKMEMAIDRLALLGFDVYSNCRQRLYEIRVNEVKNQISGFMRKSGFVCDFEQPNPELNEVIVDKQ
jgi:hypothetical protein